MDFDDIFYTHSSGERSAATRFFEMGLGPHDALFSRIPTRDLVRLMRTCRRIWHLIQETCFGLDRLLSPFFGDASKVQQFRAMQGRTGTLISGSIALQLLNRLTWPDADLDLYVSRTRVALVVLFIVRNGYTFAPRKCQDKDESVQLLASMAEDPPSYLGRGIADVLDFRKGSKKIQVIVATGTPMEIILSFHSTCVMNVITAEHAYALYPWSTFVTKEALIVETVGAGQEAGRQKYTDRGWTMIPLPSVSSKSEFGVRVARSFGDHFTWTLPLPPLAFEIADIDPITSWQLDCDGETTRITWNQLDVVAPGGTDSPAEEMVACKMGALRDEIEQLRDKIRAMRAAFGAKFDDTSEVRRRLGGSLKRAREF